MRDPRRLLWLLAIVFLAGGGGRPARADLHVASDGSDAGPGTRSKPFSSLERARDEVRRLRREGRIPARGLTVWIHGRNHRRATALELGPEDSGTSDGPIVWRSRPGEAVRLLGGVVLEGFVPVTDPGILARLDPSARSNVVQLNLRMAGISATGGLQSRGFGRATAPAHSELFHDGRPMTLARWPNEGEFVKIAGFPAGSGKGDDHGGSIGDLPGGFLYDGDRPRRWKETTDLWVHGYWAWDWANSYEHVAALDRDARLLKTDPPHGLYGFRKGQRFYFLNVLEELDQPGEWFLDRRAGVLYFWPPTSGPAAGRGSSSSRSGRETILSLLDQPLLRLSGASHVVFRGLILEATRGSAVEIRGGVGNRVEGCVIRNIGNHGVVVDGGRDHGVRSCDITDTGDGGVNLTGGDRKTLEPGGHWVENCHFQRQGRWSKCYVPAVHLQGVGLRASHNLIHDHPHCAILFWGNDHRIEFNDIHHVALETGDVGAIYTGRDYTFRGNRIRHNYIHETGGVGMGSMGVYMDDCVSGTEIFGNVFFKVQRAAFLGGGRDHRVENNLFVDCNHAVELDGRGLDRSPVWRNMVDVTMRRSLQEVPLDLYRARYPAMRTLDGYYGPPGGPAIAGDDFKGVPPEDNVVARNVCVGKWTRVGWHAQPAQLHLADNLVDADPEFVSVERRDFRLKKSSPAWRLGFQPLPMDRIGLQQDEHRRGRDRKLSVSP